jgi:hypothetical protein
MPRSKRTEHTRWQNDSPITDMFEAIEILQTTGTTLRETHLQARPKEAGDGYEICVPWARDGSSGGDTSGTHYFQVDSALVEKMKEERLLTPYIEKYWGGSRVIEDQLVLTTHANMEHETFWKDMKKKAESMLKPGVHTDLTGKPKRLGSGRDGFQCGKLYFDYELPGERGKVRVYPQEDRLVMPEEKQAQSA